MTIDAFVVRERRERYRLLLGDPKRRREGLDRFNHHTAGGAPVEPVRARS